MTPKSVRLTCTPVLVANLALCFACESGQIGGEVQEPGPGAGDAMEGGMGAGDAMGMGEGSCEEGESTLLAPDAVTSLGFAGQDLLDLVAGEHEATLAWGVPPQQSSLVEVVPAAGESRIVVRVTPDPTTLRLVERHPAALSGLEGDVTDVAAFGCQDELRVDAVVAVTTDNGALNETFEVTFSATSANYVQASVPVVPGELDGSFAATIPDTPGTETKQTTSLSLTFAPGGFSGSLWGSIEQNDGVVLSIRSVIYGTFPIESCEFGAVVGADSEFAGEVVVLLDDLHNFDLVWDSGAATQLALSHEVSRICFQEGLPGDIQQHYCKHWLGIF